MFLYPLLSLLLVFTVSHGGTIGTAGEASPWYLPKGVLRLAMVAGIVAAVAWKYSADREVLLKRLTPTPEQLWQWPELLAALGGGFTLGRLLRWGPWRNT